MKMYFDAPMSCVRLRSWVPHNNRKIHQLLAFFGKLFGRHSKHVHSSCSVKNYCEVTNIVFYKVANRFSVFTRAEMIQ